MRKRTDTDPVAYIENRIERIPECGCWLWIGPIKNKRGYGEATWDYEKWQAHRFAWTTLVGPIENGLCVLHRCDVPSCVNPKHLWLGTPEENNADRDRKGRTATGERCMPQQFNAPKGIAHCRAKLTDDIVRSIRTDTAPQRAIAARYGIAQASVSDIKRGKHWKHVV